MEVSCSDGDCLEAFPDKKFTTYEDALRAADVEVDEFTESTRNMISNWKKNLDKNIKLSLSIKDKLKSYEK